MALPRAGHYPCPVDASPRSCPRLRRARPRRVRARATAGEDRGAVTVRTSAHARRRERRCGAVSTRTGGHPNRARRTGRRLARDLHAGEGDLRARLPSPGARPAACVAARGPRLRLSPTRRPDRRRDSRANRWCTVRERDPRGRDVARHPCEELPAVPPAHGRQCRRLFRILRRRSADVRRRDEVLVPVHVASRAVHVRRGVGRARRGAWGWAWAHRVLVGTGQWHVRVLRHAAANLDARI